MTCTSLHRSSDLDNPWQLLTSFHQTSGHFRPQKKYEKIMFTHFHISHMDHVAWGSQEARFDNPRAGRRKKVRGLWGAYSFIIMDIHSRTMCSLLWKWFTFLGFVSFFLGPNMSTCWRVMIMNYCQHAHAQSFITSIPPQKSVLVPWGSLRFWYGGRLNHHLPRG